MAEDRRTYRNVVILVLVQAISGAQMPIVFTISGLAGQSLASNVCWATLPISCVVFGSMTTAPWLSALMQRFGRRIGFLCGNLGGLGGGIVGMIALQQASFPLFLVASYLTGIYMSANGFLRFAAADTASKAFQAKAISYVMAGGLLAAIIGPQLVKASHDQFAIPFMGSFLVIIGLNAVGALLLAFLDIPTRVGPGAISGRQRSWHQLLRDRTIVVAMICAMVSYALMNLVMTSTPLAVVGCGYTTGNAADIVTAHVLAMFAPSFITGHVIARIGAVRVVMIGLVLLAGAGGAAIADIALTNFFVALILLGFGWNFGFIGATAMLVDAHEPTERGRVQGMNDMVVFGCVTIASLTSGLLMNCTGGTAELGWTWVNWAMAPFLLLAGLALYALYRDRVRGGRQPAG